MKLVGLVGHAGVGKNTFAEAFHYHGYREYSIAHPFKQAAAILHNLDISWFLESHFKDSTHSFWNKSPRQMVQEVTKVMLEKYGNDFQARLLDFRLMRAYQGDAAAVKVILPDVRHATSIDYILSKGGVIIHLTRPGQTDTVGYTDDDTEVFVSKFQEYVDSLPESLQNRIHHVSNDSSISKLQDKANAIAESLFS